jgi:hypothetical protein
LIMLDYMDGGRDFFSKKRPYKKITLDLRVN